MEIDDGDEQAEDANHGDWLWRGEGDPDDEPAPNWSTTPTEAADDEAANAAADDGSTADRDGDAEPGTDEPGPGPEPESASKPTERSEPTDEPSATPKPKVPGDSAGPVGVPEESGGAGGGKPSRHAESGEGQGSSSHDDSESTERTSSHGDASDPDDMTLAFTYRAINRLADPQYAVADARGWSDWIGIVGTVSTPAIRKFQRDTGIDIDFFGGSETGPAERLADITPESMFYADRMVLVGTAGDDEIADAADWEFVPLETAAENADWAVEFSD
ncbi:hypothetical protein C493_14168 [Natronolimnohabitans innermongolicus JCM 12255]|uniref:DUF7124 domain-containing protein n=2 Tax=Natronolimnohabitans innermongolicus TaxID=253107 RepID=L9WV94_9EURY|nr:hypothetical protein C493_14168 [Natronolimnohabitans innermongolicus JCM 12255]